MICQVARWRRQEGRRHRSLPGRPCKNAALTHQDQYRAHAAAVFIWPGWKLPDSVLLQQRGVGRVMKRADHPGHVPQRRPLQPALAERDVRLALEVNN